jgi:branched-chain amino acid transport system ATP-binding protein
VAAHCGTAGVSALLHVEGVSKRFGGVRAVDGMDLAVAPASVVGVIGPNGSGKTTFLGLLSGTYRPDAGRIMLEGARVDGLAAHRTVEAGIARTFQTTRLFGGWTLRANLDAAAAVRPGVPDHAEVLTLTGLAGREDAICASLSNAEQRLAMIAVALATRPKLLLLDEPAVGMSPAEAASLARGIGRIRDARGLAVLIVEHNMHLMMNLAERIVVMNAGRKLAEGTPAEIRANPDVIACYLGG